MATIRKRNGKYQVQIRIQGCTPISRTFTKLEDAKSWARLSEIEAEQVGLPADPRILAHTKVGDILERYRDEVIPKKRGHEIETIIVNAILRQPFCKLSLAHADGAIFAAYRDTRLSIVQPCTIKRELGMIQHAFDIAAREWAIPLRSNPIKAIAKPGASQKRERRLVKGEITLLYRTARQCRNNHMRPLILIAVETAMRQGELLSARWRDINLDERLWLIPITKNGERRTIPLTKRCVRLLKVLKRAIGNDSNARVFDLSREAVKCSWRRIVKRGGIADLNRPGFAGGLLV